MSKEALSFYVGSGQGETIKERGMNPPLYEEMPTLNAPQQYVASQGLRDAVNVSLWLGQPLLVTGEPGTGKTQLASSIAYEFNREVEPLVFYTKTTSVAKDLFYRYDALAHFHDSQDKEKPIDIESYITYEALGIAILLAGDPQKVNPYLPAHLQGKGPRRAVVLIDEIDKAPRDLPNDILNEIENMSFRVNETGKIFTAEQKYRPALILTSNSEKNLPDAFLRRCIFYHIPFPDNLSLEKIVKGRLVRKNPTFTDEMIKNAIAHFEQIRDLPLKKKPATAELLAWMRVLEKIGLDVGSRGEVPPDKAEALAFTYSILAKNKDDNDLILQSLLPAGSATP